MPIRQSDEEIRLTISKAVQSVLEKFFRNHINQCENTPLRQVVSGGIRARVLMDVWADKLDAKLNSNNITLLMLVKYVDVINMILRSIPRCYSWRRGPTHVRKEGEKESDLNLVWS